MRKHCLVSVFLFTALTPIWCFAGPKVVVAALTSEQLAELADAAPSAEVVSVKDEQDAMNNIGDADALMGILTQELVNAGKKLKWIQVYSAGVERYRFPELIDSDITLTNCKILQGPNIADHAFALLLPLTRKITHARAYQEKGEWARVPSTLLQPPPNELPEHLRRPAGARLRSPKNIQIATARPRGWVQRVVSKTPALQSQWLLPRSPARRALPIQLSSFALPNCCLSFSETRRRWQFPWNQGRNSCNPNCNPNTPIRADIRQHETGCRSAEG